MLTCGSCQKDFLLADILRFIQHKVTCQGGSTSPRDTSLTTESGSEDATPKKSEGASSPEPKSPSSVVKEEEDLNDQDQDAKNNEEKRKREDDGEDSSSARKRPRNTQDAEANTTDSGKLNIFIRQGTQEIGSFSHRVLTS